MEAGPTFLIRYPVLLPDFVKHPIRERWQAIVVWPSGHRYELHPWSGYTRLHSAMKRIRSIMLRNGWTHREPVVEIERLPKAVPWEPVECRVSP